MFRVLITRHYATEHVHGWIIELFMSYVEFEKTHLTSIVLSQMAFLTSNAAVRFNISAGV